MKQGELPSSTPICNVLDNDFYSKSNIPLTIAAILLAGACLLLASILVLVIVVFYQKKRRSSLAIPRTTTNDFKEHFVINTSKSAADQVFMDDST